MNIDDYEKELNAIFTKRDAELARTKRKRATTESIALTVNTKTGGMAPIESKKKKR